jgi:hypothetical protein
VTGIQPFQRRPASWLWVYPPNLAEADLALTVQVNWRRDLQRFDISTKLSFIFPKLMISAYKRGVVRILLRRSNF